MPKNTPESRTQMVGARVSPREKLAIEWVAGVKGSDVSNLLREMSIAEILAERDRLAHRLEAVG